MITPRRCALVLVPILAASTMCLTACSGLDEVTRLVQKNYHEESFATVAEAKAGWVGVTAPEWLPVDSTDIHNRATNNEGMAVIAVKSDAALPSWCVEGDRKHLPYTSTSWTPALPTFPDEVEDCGDYEVMNVEGGYLGWYSATAQDEKPAAGPTS